MSKIVEIKEVENLKLDESWRSYEGYKITLTDKTIILLVDDGQSCCESFGYICSEDNLKDFIGAEVLDIETTELNEDDYKTKSWLGESFGYVEVLECAFVSLQTDKGKLQFAVYNHHNGYYGHEVLIEVKKNER